jgi:hypothetical protein
MPVFEHHWVVRWDQEVQKDQAERRGGRKSNDHVVETEWNWSAIFQFQLNSWVSRSYKLKQLSSVSKREWRYSKIT